MPTTRGPYRRTKLSSTASSIVALSEINVRACEKITGLFDANVR
jgi:hypothetical protein